MNVNEKIKKLREIMHEKAIDLYYIPTDDAHMSEYIAEHYQCRKYMSGFSGSAGTLVVTKDSAGLWVDGRYHVQAEKELAATNIDVYKMGMANVPNVLDYLVENCKEQETIAFDGKVVSTSLYQQLMKKLEGKNVHIKCDEDLVDLIWQDRPTRPKSMAYILEDEYTGETISNKIEKVRTKLAEKEALIIASLEDIAWLFNMRGNDIMYTPINYAYAIVTKKEVKLYIDQAKLSQKTCAFLESIQVDLLPYDEIANSLANIEQDIVWIDSSKLNIYLYQKITKEIKDEESPIVMYRAQKNSVEIANSKKAHIKDGVAMFKLLYWLKQNVGKIKLDEVMVQNKLYELRQEQNNYVEPSFETICAYQENAAMMHYSANETRNKAIDATGFLLIDSGGTYLEGTTDITRTIHLGKASKEEKFYYTTVLRAMLNLANAKFLYGVTAANLDILARGICWQHGLDYRCGTGHAVGHILGIHEDSLGISWSVKSKMTTRVIEEGMIITDEPGIYLPDQLGIRIENELVVVKGEKNEYGQFMYFEPITMCPIDLEAIDVTLMSEQEIKWLNDYHQQVYDALSPHLDDAEKDYLKTLTEKVSK